MLKVLLVHTKATAGLGGTLFADRSDAVVTLVDDGQKALDHLAGASRADLILCDTAVAGDVDAFQLVLGAKEHAPGACVMVLSNTVPAFTGRPPVGAVLFYKKPIDPVEMRKEALALVDAAASDPRYTLDKLELIDIVQLACLSRRTVVLHLRHLDRKGRLGMAGGHVVHAKFGELEGNEALFELLALPQGDMFVQNGARPKQKTVNGRWQDLMIEATNSLEHRRAQHEALARELANGPKEDPIADLMSGPGDASLEEVGGLFDAADLAEIGDLSDIAGVAQELPVSKSTADRPRFGSEAAVEARQHQEGHEGIHMASQDPELLIEGFCDEIPEFIATDIVHRPDGLSLIGASAAPEYDSQSACAFYSDFLNSCTRAVSGFGLDRDLQEVHVSTGQAYIIIRAIGDSPYMHLLLMHRSGNLGIAKVVMRKYEPLFADALPSYR